jgi:hypothetical protein
VMVWSSSTALWRVCHGYFSGLSDFSSRLHVRMHVYSERDVVRCVERVTQ